MTQSGRADQPGKALLCAGSIDGMRVHPNARRRPCGSRPRPTSYSVRLCLSSSPESVETTPDGVNLKLTSGAVDRCRARSRASGSFVPLCAPRGRGRVRLAWNARSRIGSVTAERPPGSPGRLRCISGARSPVPVRSMSAMRNVNQLLRFKSRDRGSEVDLQHVYNRLDLVRRHMLQEVVDQVLLAGLADRRPVHDE